MRLPSGSVSSQRMKARKPAMVSPSVATNISERPNGLMMCFHSNSSGVRCSEAVSPRDARSRSSTAGRSPSSNGLISRSNSAMEHLVVDGLGGSHHGLEAVPRPDEVGSLCPKLGGVRGLSSNRLMQVARFLASGWYQQPGLAVTDNAGDTAHSGRYYRACQSERLEDRNRQILRRLPGSRRCRPRP